MKPFTPKPIEPGPLPEHHKQWFSQLQKAAKNGHLALMSCLDSATNESRSVICLVSYEDGDYLFTPVGHLCTADNPFEAYGPPGSDFTNKEVVPL